MPSLAELGDDAAALCHDLLRLDTTNPGRPERPAAEYVAEKLSDAGLHGRIVEVEPGRSNYVVRFEGDGTSPEALVVHGHLDVVPAVADEWSVHPFSGELADGCLWGRGAVDMKGTVAMMLAVARRMATENTRPRRDLVFAFFADEEAGSLTGAKPLVDGHPDLFEGATAAVGELGGFSVTLAPGQRLYPIQVAEKGGARVRVWAEGRPGHSSMPHADSALVKLAEAVARLGRVPTPLHVTAPAAAFLRALGELTGKEIDPADPAAALAALGELGAFVAPTLRNTFCPTIVAGGYKSNVIPSVAEATVSARILPGHEESYLDELDAILGPDVRREVLMQGDAVEAPWDHPLPAAMGDALRAEDPAARTAPFMIPAATDAKSLARLGMACYGFSPLLLPPDLDFAALFHGIDERVPVDALAFGARVLHRLLTTY